MLSVVEPEHHPSHANRVITTVRIAVAKADGTPSTPSLAKIAVAAAAAADTSGYASQDRPRLLRPASDGLFCRRERRTPVFQVQGRHDEEAEQR